MKSGIAQVRQTDPECQRRNLLQRTRGDVTFADALLARHTADVPSVERLHHFIMVAAVHKILVTQGPDHLEKLMMRIIMEAKDQKRNSQNPMGGQFFVSCVTCG